MAKTNILKEAIADAKAVREVALANAKAALEEAFTPKLQSMLSAKLSEDLDETYYDEDEKEVELGEMGGMHYDEDEKDMDEMMYDEDEKDNMNNEVDLEEILNELELEEDDKADEKEEDIDEAVGYPNYRADQVQKVKMDADDINQGLNESFNLDSLLEEINNLEEEEEILEVEDDEVDEQMMMRSQTRNAPMRKAPMRRNKPMGGKRRGGCMEENTTINSLKTQLNESNKALSTIKSELNEVNLLNSKLLYVNRIFKANTLDEAQKLRVVETLDKATSIKEAKLIYETVKNTFTISTPKKKKTISKKPIRENFGMASKATGMSRTKKVAPKKAILRESDNMVARMQKLANISKIKE